MFLQRRIVLLSNPESAKESLTRDVMATGTTCTEFMFSSLKGSSVRNAAFSRSFFWNESVSMITTAFGFTYLVLVFNAAGFMATKTSALSPGVYTPLPICT